jgi:hypothetical protein
MVSGSAALYVAEEGSGSLQSVLNAVMGTTRYCRGEILDLLIKAAQNKDSFDVFHAKV